MSPGRIESVARRIADLPGLWHLRRRRYEQRVRRGVDWQFWGVFPTREEALSAAKALKQLPVGYDNPGVAQRGRETYERMHSFDYPALLSIARSLARGGHHVVDLGGHLAAKYRAYRRIWTFPDNLRWTVCETADVVNAAKDLQDHDRPPGVSFTSEQSCIQAADTLFASGVLQYLDRPLRAILADGQRLPPNLVLNKVPLSEGPEIWTIQRAGGVLVPYHVMNRDEFFKSLQQFGYRVVDEWTVPEYAARIPFAPGVGTKHNSGLALELVNA